MKFRDFLAVVMFAATIPAANWMIGNVGECRAGSPCVVPVGFGQFAPSGVLMVGVALVLRDLIHEIGGRWLAFSAVVIGAAVSAIVAPAGIAIASVAAFAVSEGADMAVFAAIRRRGFVHAVLASQAVGAVLDSVIFLQIAFGSPDFWIGNAIGKMYAAIIVSVPSLVYTRICAALTEVK